MTEEYSVTDEVDVPKWKILVIWENAAQEFETEMSKTDWDFEQVELELGAVLLKNELLRPKPGILIPAQNICLVEVLP